MKKTDKKNSAAASSVVAKSVAKKVTAPANGLNVRVQAKEVHNTLKKHILADGFSMVLDLYNSSGSYMTDARTGDKYLDLFTCFASMPVGLNHPAMMDKEFIYKLGEIALNKPSNSDLYTEAMAEFVKTFFDLAVPKHFKYGFFIEGGALAIENALKVAFDWKIQKNFRKGYVHERGHSIMHFQQAFHGRSGYTMSLTNTDEKKIKYFPKFQDWPRILNPAIRFPMTGEHLEHTKRLEKQSIEQMKQAFFEQKDQIAAIIIEPIQGEGGDNHFRPEFLKKMRELADENDALLIFDEVQTGVGITGTMWVHEQLGVKPDIMAFGKKMQVCGLIAGDRVDEIETNVFRVPSRINSTWGGNLVDMVRAGKYLEIIRNEKLVENAATVGGYLQKQLVSLENQFSDIMSNSRGRGLFSAFDLASPEIRDEFRRRCYDHKVIVLGCGDRSIRFRPPVNLTKGQVDEGVAVMNKVLKSLSAKKLASTNGSANGKSNGAYANGSANGSAKSSASAHGANSKAKKLAKKA
jgi:L-lysine 6-transaminase